MFKMKPVRRIQYQHLLKDRDRTLQRFQDFGKLRISLLQAIYKLLTNVQLKSQNTTSNQALESLNQCRDGLTNCLKSLKSSNHNLNKINPFVLRVKYSKVVKKVFKTYLASVRKVISNYVKYQATVRVLEQRITVRNTLKRMLSENIGVLDLAIKILERFMKTGNDFPFQSSGEVLFSKRVPYSNSPSKVSEESERDKFDKQLLQTCKDILADINQTNSDLDMPPSREEGGKLSSISVLDIMCSDTSLKFMKHLHKLRADTAKSSKHLLNISCHKFPGGKTRMGKHRDSSSPRLSSEARGDSLKSTASYLIHNLFKRKHEPRATLRVSLKNKSFQDNVKWNIENTTEEDQIDEVWNELVKEHNQLISEDNHIVSDIKEDLKKFYLMKMQLALKDQIGQFGKSKKRSKVSSFRPSLFANRSYVKWDTRNTDPMDKVQSMHRQLYNQQLKKLQLKCKDLDKVREMYNLIMSQELPIRESDLELLKEYGRDTHHYNILMLTLRKDSEQSENLVEIIERNFERIMVLLNRKKRREKMSQRSTIIYQPSTDTIDSLWKDNKYTRISFKTPSPFVISEDYFKVERAKWAKYFAEQEKTPTMLHLEHQRRQKLLALSVQRMLERKRLKLLKKASRRGQRCITELYTAPRLTARMRRANDQMAQEAYFSTAPQPEKMELRSELGEESSVFSQADTAPNIADVILDSASCTSCCSKCCTLQQTRHPTPALDQFLRTQEQIAALGYQICPICYPSKQ